MLRRQQGLVARFSSCACLPPEGDFVWFDEGREHGLGRRFDCADDPPINRLMQVLYLLGSRFPQSLPDATACPSRRFRKSRGAPFRAVSSIRVLDRDNGSHRSLVPVVVNDLRKPLASLRDPQRQHSALGTLPNSSKCVSASALQRADDLQSFRREYAAVIYPPEILSRSPKLRGNLGEHRAGSIDEDKTRQRILSAALELKECDLFLRGQPHERPAMDHCPVTKRGERLAREKAGRGGIDRVSEDRIDAPRQLVEIAGGPPSVTGAFDLAAIELHRDATAPTAERRPQEFWSRQVRKLKEPTAALIRKPETAVAVGRTRQIPDLCAACHDQAAETETG